MTVAALLERVEGLGYRLGLRPGGLRLTGDTQPTPKLLALIQEHREGLLALLEAKRDLFEERAGILEFDVGFTRAEAERLAALELDT